VAEEPVLTFKGPDRTLEFVRSDIGLAEAGYRPEAAAVHVCLREPAMRRLRAYMATIIDKPAELRVGGELLARMIVYEVQKDPCAWYATGDIDEAGRMARRLAGR